VRAGAARPPKAGAPPPPTRGGAEPDPPPLPAELERARRSVRDHLDALRDEQDRQHALLRALRTPLLLADADGRIADLNAAAEELLGPGASRHLVGRPIRDCLPFVAAGDQRELPTPAIHLG